MKTIAIIGFVIFYLYLIASGEDVKYLRKKILNKLYLSQKTYIKRYNWVYHKNHPPEYAPEYIKTIYRNIESKLRNDISLVYFDVSPDLRTFYNIIIIARFIDAEGRIFQINCSVDKLLLDYNASHPSFFKSIILNIMQQKNEYILSMM